MLGMKRILAHLLFIGYFEIIVQNEPPPHTHTHKKELKVNIQRQI